MEQIKKQTLNFKIKLTKFETFIDGEFKIVAEIIYFYSRAYVTNIIKYNQYGVLYEEKGYLYFLVAETGVYCLRRHLIDKACNSKNYELYGRSLITNNRILVFNRKNHSFHKIFYKNSNYVLIKDFANKRREEGAVFVSIMKHFENSFYREGDIFIKGTKKNITFMDNFSGQIFIKKVPRIRPLDPFTNEEVFDFSFKRKSIYLPKFFNKKLFKLYSEENKKKVFNFLLCLKKQGNFPKRLTFYLLSFLRFD